LVRLEAVEQAPGRLFLGDLDLGDAPAAADPVDRDRHG
jgi:hypothetical protein